MFLQYVGNMRYNSVALGSFVEIVKRTKHTGLLKYRVPLISFNVGWFYGISTFAGYLTPNPFLCK